MLLNSYATGFEIDNPIENLNEGEHFKYFPYPESFSGLSMQYAAYYGNKGGFYFASLDADGHQKWLNFNKVNQMLLISHMYGYENVLDHTHLIMPYTFIVKAFEGDWYDASDLYKSWAINQSFCPEKTINRIHAHWLYQNIGMATFGISASKNRTLWIEKYHDVLKIPVLHILGPDWTEETQSFRGQIPSTIDTWKCTNINKKTLDVIHQQNDYVALFEFDYLINPKTDSLSNMLQIFPKPAFSHDAYHFKMLCPAHKEVKDFHIKRDLSIIIEHPIDSMYYDISANNLSKICTAETHDHVPGGGYQITKAYYDNYMSTKEAISHQKGSYFPLGTEMINEFYLGAVDYYQARAWAQPSSTLEGWPFRELILKNKARFIPMFSYVFHEYGALRIDGWGKIVKEIGTYFYTVVARVYLWGGIYEINHEYSPMEVIDGQEPSKDEHYTDYVQRNYDFDQTRLQYIKQFATLRTGIGNPFLAYGKMLKPLKIDSSKNVSNWFHYNHGIKSETYETRGVCETESILTSSYESSDHKVAHFLANVSQQDQCITIHFCQKKKFIKLLMYTNFKDLNDNHKEIYINDQTNTITLTIKKERVVMLLECNENILNT